jgi:hypothetical protein
MVNPEDEVDMKYWNLALGRDMSLESDNDGDEEDKNNESVRNQDGGHSNSRKIPVADIYNR